MQCGQSVVLVEAKDRPGLILASFMKLFNCAGTRDGAGPQGPASQSDHSFSARKFTAIIAMARLPTTNALSSTKNSGLWFGAAVAGS